MGRALADQSAEPAFKALLLALPSESRPGHGAATRPIPAAIHEAREPCARAWPCTWANCCAACTAACRRPASSRPTPQAPAAGRCATRALELLAADPHADNRERALGHFRAAANMTDAMGGLTALMLIGGEDVRDGAGRLLRALEGRAAGHRQVVLRPGAQPGGGRARPRAGPDRPSGLRRPEPQPPARPGGGLRQPPTRRGSTIRPAPATASWPTRSWPSTASTR